MAKIIIATYLPPLPHALPSPDEQTGQTDYEVHISKLN